ncbi:MAG TPA: EcsC family protein [Desulfosarcina sp.]|nr:EcsC family protein [Desulfosarcina sp.]
MTIFDNRNDLSDLKRAKALLEHPGLAARLTGMLGMPIEKGFDLLPAGWHRKITDLTRAALTKAVNTAVLTMKDAPGEAAANTLHKLAVAATGGIGGLFGLPALSIELPVSTTIMLRSIADVARSEHENIRHTDTRMACIEVFALGGPDRSDDAAESGYFAVRAALAQSVSRAAEYLSAKGLAEEGAPALVRLIVQVAQRFSIQVSEKIAAQAIPAIGAVGGAAVNALFMDHFQDMARGHFIVRRLERVYGREAVERAYKEI